MLNSGPIRELMAKNGNLFNAPRTEGKYLACLVLSLLVFHPGSLQAVETPPALEHVGAVPIDGYAYPSISADEAGNSYAAFLVNGALNVGKFSSSGALLWRTEQPGDLSYDARIKVDAGGNSYVAATDYSSNSGYLYKFDANGAFAGKRTVPAGITNYWESDDIAYDPLSGHIYTTISFYNEDTRNGCVMVLAYDSNLELVASRTINDSPLDNWFARLAVDPQGNVYVNGLTSGDSAAGNWLNGFFEAKYSPGLSSLTFKTDPVLFDGMGKWLRATAADAQGNTYSAGEIEQGNNDYPAFLMKRNEAGALVFLRTFPDPDPSDWAWNTFYDVAVDKRGNPHVVNTDYSVSLIKYDPDGNILWSIKPSTPPFQLETSGIDIDGQGNIYTAGIWSDADYNYSGVVMKYSAAAAPDTTPPAAVTDLAVTVVSSGTITLAWTAPGDDGTAGTAAAYDLRYTVSGAITTDEAFTAAAPVPGVPAPQAAGTPETFTVTGLLPGTTYFFSLKTADEAGNISGLSNSAQGATSEACVEVIGVPNWKQFNDGTNDWWDNPYNHTTNTIGKSGCALTAVSQVITEQWHSTDPGELNSILKITPSGFRSGGRVNFEVVSQLSSLDYMEEDFTALNQLHMKLEAGNPVILWLWSLKARATGVRPSHFVVAVGKCGDTIYINDPGHSSIYSGRPTLEQYFNRLPVGLREIRALLTYE